MPFNISSYGFSDKEEAQRVTLMLISVNFLRSLLKWLPPRSESARLSFAG